MHVRKTLVLLCELLRVHLAGLVTGAFPTLGHLIRPNDRIEMTLWTFLYALSAFAMSGATDTVLTPLSSVSVASTASTPER